MKKVFMLLVLMHVLIGYEVFAQSDMTTTDTKAKKYFEKARDLYYQRAFTEALQWNMKALQRDDGFLETYLLGSEIYIEMDLPHEAISFLEKMLRINDQKYYSAYNLLGSLYSRTEQYNEALVTYEKYLDKIDNPEVTKQVELVKYRLQMMENPVDVQLVSLGDSINTRACEYVNAVTMDGEWLYFTRRPPSDARSKGEKWDEDFYYSHHVDSMWCKAKNLGEPVNTLYNEGAMHLSPDRQYLFYTSCRGQDGFGSCDLYYAKSINDTLWTDPKSLGSVINGYAWETQPCFSADGRTLYFVSTRSGGYGGADIWKSKLDDDSGWTRPENLGKSINTRGEEMAPYLHPDGKTLYFSSNHHKGMGGQDLFKATLQPDSTWSKPVNLGFPINDIHDQINLVVDASGVTAYISSEIADRCYDIFSFVLPEELRPEKVAYLKGTVRNKDTKAPLSARFELIDLEKNDTVVISRSRPDGSYIVALPTGKDYGFYAEKRGFLFYSENFQFDNHSGEPQQKDIELEPIKLSAKVELKNIFFAFDSDSLMQKSEAELEKLLNFLGQNPYVMIEIQGHTDNKGTTDYNQTLSENRAGAVLQYLQNKKVEAWRIRAKGYGESQPVSDNDTEKGRALNRRTEIMVIGIRQ